VGRDRVPELAEYFAGEFRAAGYADSDIHILPNVDHWHDLITTLAGSKTH
jgi:hypothetical protein